MAGSSKSKKPSKIPEDIDAIRSDVASFASSLGLSSSLPSSSSGFNDSDFLKTGPLKPKPNKSQKQKNQTINNTNENNEKFKPNKGFDKPKPNPKYTQKPKFQNFNPNERDKNTQKPKDQALNTNEKFKPKPPVLAVDDSDKQRGFGKPRIDSYIRITIGTKEQMNALVMALEDIIK